MFQELWLVLILAGGSQAAGSIAGTACRLCISETSSFIALVMAREIWIERTAIVLKIRASYYGGRHECWMLSAVVFVTGGKKPREEIITNDRNHIGPRDTAGIGKCRFPVGQESQLKLSTRSRWASSCCSSPTIIRD